MRNGSDVAWTPNGILRGLRRLNPLGVAAAATGAARRVRGAAIAAADTRIDVVMSLGAVVAVIDFVAAPAVRIRAITVASGANDVSGQNEGSRRDG